MFSKRTAPEPLKPPKYTWPNCAPPDPGWGCTVLSDGAHHYKQAEVEPGRWQWVINQEAERAAREIEQSRADLWWALRTRVLSDDEMQEVRHSGSSLNIRSGEIYCAGDKARELNDALYNQARLKMLALELKAPEQPAVLP